MSTARVIQWDIHALDAITLRRFYTDVFDWRCTHPDDPDGYGWMLTPDGVMLGGIGQAADGDAPGVSFFVQVPDVTATIEDARRLGGTVYRGPLASPDGMVRACIGDPEGSGVLLIRPSDSGEPYASFAPINADTWHWEISGTDPGRLATFYGSLFNWSIDAPNEWRWSSVRTGPQGGPDGGITPGGSPRVMIYAPADDLRATLDRIESHGGETDVEPWQPPQGPEIAIFTDPEGNRIGLRRSSLPCDAAS